METIFSNNRVKIRGRIVEGLREAGNFTQIPWVKKQFISKLSIDPYPGTLNLEIPNPSKPSKNLRPKKELKLHLRTPLSAAPNAIPSWLMVY